MVTTAPNSVALQPLPAPRPRRVGRPRRTTPAPTPLPLRLHEDLYDAISQMAIQQGRSVNAVACELLALGISCRQKIPR